MSGSSTPDAFDGGARTDSQSDLGRPGEGLTLLLADDDAQLREALTMHLESRGYDVTEAADGEAALAEATRLIPDIAILDIVMPGANGWDVARSLRKNPETKDIRLLMLSGIGKDVLGPNLPILGGDVGLDKPFELDELDEALRVLLTT
tara:strand:- start:47642 stop:48088 length:447 start_codon:yes stop_codon:yes gene_type:complete